MSPFFAHRRAAAFFLSAFALFLCAAPSERAGAQNLDSMLQVLDTCLLRRGEYTAIWDKEGDALRQTALATQESRAALETWQSVVDFEFARHGARAIEACDKALHYARLVGDAKAEATIQQRKAIVYGMCGLPWDGRMVLDSLYADSRLRPLIQTTVWTTYYDLFDYFYPYNLPAQLADRNHLFLRSIEDSVRKYVADAGRLALTLSYASQKKEDMVRALLGRLEKAKAVDKGMIATTISNKYLLMRDMPRRDYWLAYAAVLNLRAGRHDNEALNRLALRRAEMGDYERAVRYAAAGYAEAVSYGSRTRVLEVAPVMANALTYETQRADSANRRALWTLVAALAFLVGGIGLALWQRRRQRQLQVELQQLRVEMGSGQHALDEARSAAATNEEYVARFLELGLDTILKFEQMKQLVLNKLQAGETERLKQLMKDPALLDNFRQKSLSRFDIAFLRRYPDFVQEVNALLRPEEAITLPDTEIMNNELRLLAFMRLGITDSAKIAAILGVSVNTVYFYRTKLRGRAKSRSTFEEQVCGTAAH